MKVQIVIIFACICTITVIAENTFSDNNKRTSRLIPGLLSGLGHLGTSRRCKDCPVHHCRFDDAVVLGYCCGCKREMDDAPIRCPYHLDCPPSPQPLCSQYDYMMDCCC